MPTRILREGILSSPKINALSPLAELFYRRLMTVADDYGRYYAAPGTIRGACWPICPERVTEKQIAGWLDECLAGDEPLIITYTANGSKFIQIQNFGQQTRSKSKFPAPTENNTLINRKSGDNHLCSLDGVVVGDVVEGVYVAAPKTGAVSEWFEAEFWPIWVKAKNDSKGAALKSATSKAKTEEIRAQIITAIHQQRPARLREDPQYRSHASTWLNQSRWIDDGDDAPPALTIDELERMDYRNQPWRPEDDPV